MSKIIKFFIIKNSVQKWVKSTNWRKNSISPFFSLIFLLLSHYYKTIRTAFSTLKNCQKTHLKTACHSSMSGKQKKIKRFLLLLKSMKNGVIDFLRQGDELRICEKTVFL